MTPQTKQSASITIYSHGYCVSNMTYRVSCAVEKFSKKYIDVQTVFSPVRGSRVSKDIIGGSYFGVTQSKTEYRFHINTLNDFKLFLKNNSIDLEVFTSKTLERYTGAPVSFEWHSDKSDREHQVEAIEWIVEDRKTKVLALQTGKGKTYCAMRAIRELGVRTGIILRPGYVSRWMPDLESHFGFKPEDLLWINSSAQLYSALECAQEGILNAKLIVFNNTALYKYLDDYEKSDGDNDYGCRPENLMQALGIGVRIIDEVHEFFELNYRLDCYLNTPKSILLSATLSPSNQFLKHIYPIMMPESTRYAMEFDKYVSAKAVIYNIQDANRIKCNGFMGMYSHTTFEKSLIKYGLMPNYCKFIGRQLDEYFICKRKPNQKAIVFAAQVITCNHILKELKERYPDLVVKLYVSGHSYAEAIQADIIVSTLKSAGTAVDIPGLRTTIMTTSINSDQSNEQVLGRTRNLPDGETPEFIYFVCKDIPKQVFYHNEKKRIFRGKVINHYEVESGYSLSRQPARGENGTRSRY